MLNALVLDPPNAPADRSGMTAARFLFELRRDNPSRRFTCNRQGTAIAVRVGDSWATVLGLSEHRPAFGSIPVQYPEWLTVGDLFIDGKPCNDPADWIDPIEV